MATEQPETTDPARPQITTALRSLDAAQQLGSPDLLQHITDAELTGALEGVRSLLDRLEAEGRARGAVIDEFNADLIQAIGGASDLDYEEFSKSFAAADCAADRGRRRHVMSDAAALMRNEREMSTHALLTNIVPKLSQGPRKPAENGESWCPGADA